MTRERTGLSVRAVFDEHSRYVWRALRHLGIAEADVEDLCQEVFVVVHRKLGEFEGRSEVRTWLYGISLRVAADHRRRAHVRHEHPHPDPTEGVAESPGLRPDARTEARSTLQSLLDELDDDKRAVLVLYELEGLTMKEVAAAVGCPLQTAYSRLHAARDLITELVEARRTHEGGIP